MRTAATAYGFGPKRLFTSALSNLPVFILLPFLAFAQSVKSPGSLPTLRNIHEIFLLSKTEAAQGYPIDFDAVVTYSDPLWGLLFVQDATGTTFIDVHGNWTRFPAGALVRIRAVSVERDENPAIGSPKVAVIGAGALSAPEWRSVAELDAGQGEAHRVATEGILHPCDRDWGRVCFRLCDGEKVLWLVVPEQDSQAAQNLIGAVVNVAGVAARHEDEEHKRIGAELYVNALKDIQIQSPPAPVSFSSPPSPIGSLNLSIANQRFAPRIHLRGLVTWQSPGLFTLRDDSGTIFVDTWKTTTVHTGSTMDAIGFPSRGQFGLELADSAEKPSEVQASAAGIVPLETTAAEIIQRSLNGKRVHLKARLIGQSANANEFVYQLEDGTQRFAAILLRNDATHEIVGLSRDSVLELTGVALIQNGAAQWPGTLLLLVESPKDIVVRGGIGWLTLRRGLSIFGLMAFCVITPLIWVTALRRTVRQQTAIIRSRLESEVRLETKYSRLVERNLAAVFSWRSDGVIVDCNAAFARMLGFESRDRLIGRNCHSFQTDPAQEGPLCGVIHEEPVSNREVSLRRDDGSTVHLLMNITPVEEEEGVLYETTAIDVTQLRHHQAELQRARDAAVFESLNDPLTGLPNRKLLMDTLSSLLAVAEHDAGMIALLYLDLDGFKVVNDSLGHAVGDGLLVQVAARLRSWMREGDMLARLGGDEFMVIMPRIRAREDAVMLAENLLEEVSSSFEVKEHTLAIGASVGISIFPDDGLAAEELIQRADSAMYLGKREGKNRVTCFTPEIGNQVHERLTLEHQLRGALARRELFLHYQPEFELAGHRLTRFEALARWTHPTLGKISPVKFIPIAEESGLISSLGSYLMEEACAEAVRWQGMTPYPVQVAVNISTVQFRRKGFVDEVIAILDRTGLNPHLLQIEVTESVMLVGLQQAAETIHRLREMGISMAIDDFGTGYSSLSYLPSLAFDVLKIDRAFVINLTSEPETASMIRTLITLAHNFGMQVIVEGVETEEQLALIKALGANEVQGFLTGRPTSNPMKYMLRTASL